MIQDLKALKREVRSKQTSPARRLELAMLAPEISRVVARSSHTPANVLERLAQSTDVPTLQALARHEHAPDQLLEFLAGYPNPAVRKALRDRPRIPRIILDAWATSNEADERLAAAHIRALSSDLILQLSEDKDPRVCVAIVKYHATALSQSKLEAYLVHPDRALHLMVIPNLTNPAALHALAQCDDPDVLATIAGNPSTLPDTLSTLANLVLSQDGQPSLNPLVQALLRNNNTPKHQRLSIDQMYSTRPLRAVVRTEASLQLKEPTHDHP